MEPPLFPLLSSLAPFPDPLEERPPECPGLTDSYLSPLAGVGGGGEQGSLEEGSSSSELTTDDDDDVSPDTCPDSLCLSLTPSLPPACLPHNYMRVRERGRDMSGWARVLIPFTGHQLQRPSLGLHSLLSTP